MRGDRAANLEQAIKHCQLALQIRTRDAFPEACAMTQNNLALTYSNRIRGDRAANLKHSIEHYQLALDVYRRDTFPYNFIIASINIGDIYSKQHNWSAACSAYRTVEEVGEDILTLTAGEEESTKLLSLFQKAFSHHAYALAKVKEYQTALATLEKGKTRSLNQALFF